MVLGIPHEAFDGKLAALKDERGVEHDTDLTTDDLKTLVDDYKAGSACPLDQTQNISECTYSLGRVMRLML